MSTTIVLGSQWGDEGKGKLVDILCADAKLCCRAQGGHNAGHTIVHGDKTFDVHILPSGVCSPGCMNLIGNGCVVHVPTFFKEIAALKQHGIDLVDRLFISDRAHVILDLHTIIDRLQEGERGKKPVGTTGKGIGPTYSSKATRSGIRISDIFEKGVLEAKIHRLADGNKKRFGELLDYSVEKEIAYFDEIREQLRPYIVDQVPLIKSVKEGKIPVLVEGANALMLDLDSGTYPFVTSSNTGLGGVLTSLTVGWRSIKEVIGVVKAYTTRVGSGPFPTEQINEIGDWLQSVGREVGVTTGRRRRCGWLDLVVLKYSHECNDYTSINLTKLDILDDFEEIKIGVAYKHQGHELPSFPADAAVAEQVEVDYVTMPGWKTSTKGARTYGELPENARRYIEFIEQQVGVKVKYIGTGPGRESMIVR
ncbi:adenylosuccinate synthetase-like protein [Eremomyces bilateralis CBS 781.70]|uniref:Adenylosuccinate synthetase n=1 Tax=Eremomyces bilateralis CBS 781.70 TaxID=1392243 RepID=A0A6G1FZX8_9PEZI|nr:adenylosuccinate synthetase-like protein [Eremomyces bilateralis CBS 781.70]KAF1811236.1 adenylosuccinate synthetase-like protein [Eremomyces bilateralis CBS 781.70]